MPVGRSPPSRARLLHAPSDVLPAWTIFTARRRRKTGARRRARWCGLRTRQIADQTQHVAAIKEVISIKVTLSL